MKVFLIIGAIICFFIITIITIRNSRTEVMYDCGMAEWHPDIPASVKEECRRLRKQQLQNREKQLVI